MYLPSIKRVWAWSAGMAKKIMMGGRKTHCKASHTKCHFPYSGGFGGRNTRLKYTAHTNPAIITVRIQEVRRGKLYESNVCVKVSPPSIKGSQPKRKIRRDAVAHDQYDSIRSSARENFLPKGMSLFFTNP